MTNDVILSSGVVLHNVHSESQCTGRPCVIHNPTNHHMCGWRLHWRGDRGHFERLCSHGIGHPDPDQFVYWRVTGNTSAGVHGCDGCCDPRPDRGRSGHGSWGNTRD